MTEAISNEQIFDATTMDDEQLEKIIDEFPYLSVIRTRGEPKTRIGFTYYIDKKNVIIYELSKISAAGRLKEFLGILSRWWQMENTHRMAPMQFYMTNEQAVWYNRIGVSISTRSFNKNNPNLGFVYDIDKHYTKGIKAAISEIL